MIAQTQPRPQRSRTRSSWPNSDGIVLSRAAQCAWTSGLLSAFLLGHVQAVPDWRVPVVAIGVLAPIHGIVAFLRCGGDRLSATGVFCLILAMLLTLGVSPVLSGLVPDRNFAVAALAAALVQVWVPSAESAHIAASEARPKPTIERDQLLQTVSLGSFGVALLTQFVLGRGNAPGELLALGAIVLVAIVRAVSPGETMGWIILPGVMTVVYAGLIHSGDGRLRLVSAIFVVLFLGSMVGYGRELKQAVVVGLPAGLFAMAWLRLRHVETVRTGLSEGRSGLESGIVPLDVFGQVLNSMEQGNAGLAFGSSYLSVPVFLLGRFDSSIESTAIGYELVTITQPTRAGSGFSLAGLMLGEWVLNFGLLTIPLFVLILRSALMRFDRVMTESWNRVRQDPGPANVFRMAVVTTFFSGIPDYVWAGSHTLLLRVLLRCIPLALIALAFVLLERPSRREPRGSDPRVKAALHKRG